VKKKLVLALVLSLATPVSNAATAVKMVGLKPTTSIQLSQNQNDQVAALITSPTAITVVGSSDSAGFISAYDRSATTLLWNLKLGAFDSVATAVTKDPTGDLWIVGASAFKPDPIAKPSIPAGTLNPSGVLPDTSTALPQLKELDIWRVANNGVLLRSYSRVMSDVIYPSSIAIKAGRITVVGLIASHTSDQFTITMAADGTFGTQKISSVKAVNSTTKEIKTTLSIWRSFTTSQAIRGLPSWKPKQNSHVLVRYDLKTKAVMAAYSSSGEILDVAWEKSIGIVALLNFPTGYAIAVVK
jgi:hypothetical protein